MRIKTTELPLIFSSVIPRKADAFEAKPEYKDNVKTGESQKVNGRVVYRTDLQALVLDDDGNPSRVDNNVSLSVLEPTDILPGVQYRAAGDILVGPYIKGTRIGYGIIAERVEPVKK